MAQTPDTMTAGEHLSAAIRLVSENLAKVFAEAGQRQRELARQVVVAANDPVRLAGLQGKYYVRAAMDPSWATPEQLEQHLHTIRRGRSNDLRLITRTNLAGIADTAELGWNQHRDTAKARAAG